MEKLNITKNQIQIKENFISKSIINSEFVCKIEEEFNIIWHKVEHAKKDNKLDKDDVNLSEAKLKERYKNIALRRVKLAILMQHIASENNISVSEKELTDGMLNYASQYPGQEKEIFDYFISLISYYFSIYYTGISSVYYYY